MKRVLFLTTLVCQGGVMYTASAQQATDTRPNILYVFPDQMRNDACGFWREEGFREYRNAKGDPTVTPNLNRFARESLVLTSAQSNNPVSSPHRAMLMTGMYSAEVTGVPLNCNTDFPANSLNPDIETIGDVFSKAGYDCAYIGKYHLDAPTPNDPERPGHYVSEKYPVWDAYTPAERRHGFNYWYSYGTYDVFKAPHYWDNEGVKHEPYEYSPVYEAKKAIAYLKNRGNVRNPDKPFLMMVGMNPPYSPYNSLRDCMEEDYELYKDVPIDSLLFRPNITDRTLPKMKCAPYYFANVTGVDRAFGMILDALKELGLDKNTIVVFTSDHGELMCAHGEGSEAKNMPYAEAMNVPFLIRYPDKIEPRVDSLLLSSPDIMPTLIGLAGMKECIPATVQGTDYSDYMKKPISGKRPQSALYFKNAGGSFECLGDTLDFFPLARGLKTDRYTLAFFIDRERKLAKTYFYDDMKDPYQTENLSLEENKELVKKLCKELSYQLKKIDDPWFKEKVLKDLIGYRY